MTAWVCARCDVIVTTERNIPITPTRIPTTRVLGSAACSGVTSISVMDSTNLFSTSFDGVQAGIRAGDAERAAAHHLHDLSKRRHVGDELAYFDLGARELHDEAGGIGREHFAARGAQQRRN